MATEKPRFSVTLEDTLLRRVDDYQFSYRFPTRSKAVVDLVRRGLAELENETESKSASPYSGEAQKLAKDYDSLDNWGKQAVRDLTDVELARVEDESRFFQNAETEQDSKIINLYLEPAAAGIATPLVGQDYEPYELGPDDPAGAAFAIRIQGDSMEPHFPDGSTVFVNHDALTDGDIGVFCVDGGTVCKQYHYDRVLGITYLFSLNRDRADCDVVITNESNQSLVCQGRVMTKKRYPLPTVSL
ncbi:MULTISPECIES: S24 family peptidase [unclassified Oscillibacter]|uniref:S24 family peptidase n=1 Tax=unclassified Oscillibacter TaxID=2629304 RepID=UPI0025D49045|nr:MULTISPECIES: S24 family peptidase [unclassified Oscillibacter]